MKTSNNNKSKLSEEKDEDLLNLDKELKDLISTNESLKIGISKILKEIDKKNTTTNSN